jgi:hypothetical protein
MSPVDRIASARDLLKTESMHPLRDVFGSFAAIPLVLLRSSEASVIPPALMRGAPASILVGSDVPHALKGKLVCGFGTRRLELTGPPK